MLVYQRVSIPMVIFHGGCKEQCNSKCRLVYERLKSFRGPHDFSFWGMTWMGFRLGAQEAVLLNRGADANGRNELFFLLVSTLELKFWPTHMNPYWILFNFELGRREPGFFFDGLMFLGWVVRVPWCTRLGTGCRSFSSHFLCFYLLVPFQTFPDSPPHIFVIGFHFRGLLFIFKSKYLHTHIYIYLLYYILH